MPLTGLRARKCARALADIESSTKLLDELGVDDYAKALRD